jgi:methyl-accepting chemotaxis protein
MENPERPDIDKVQRVSVARALVGPLELILAPWRAVRVLARAAEDLNALAERARRDPDPVDEARERLDALFTQLETLIAAIRTVDASAVALGAGGEDLLLATRELNSTARTIETGGRDLWRTGQVLDGHTQELIAGGQDLTVVAKELTDSLRVLRAALPRLLEGLDTVEQLEESVETVADTVEPLQDVAKGVGRVSARLSRGS